MAAARGRRGTTGTRAKTGRTKTPLGFQAEKIRPGEQRPRSLLHDREIRDPRTSENQRLQRAVGEPGRAAPRSAAQENSPVNVIEGLKPLNAVKDEAATSENHEEKTTSTIGPSVTSAPSMPSTESSTTSVASATPAQRNEDTAGENRSRSPREILALQTYYQSCGSMQQTADHFGVSIGTVSKYCSGISVPPEVRERQTQKQSQAIPLQIYGDEPERDQSNDGHVGDEDEKLPPVRYPVLAKSSQIQPIPNGNPNWERETTRSYNASIDPLERSFAAAALSSGMDVPTYVRKKVLPDMRLADLMRRTIPHPRLDDPDEEVAALEQNFLDLVEDALTHQRYDRNARASVRAELEEGKSFAR